MTTSGSTWVGLTSEVEHDVRRLNINTINAGVKLDGDRPSHPDFRRALRRAGGHMYVQLNKELLTRLIQWRVDRRLHAIDLDRDDYKSRVSNDADTIEDAYDAFLIDPSPVRSCYLTSEGELLLYGYSPEHLGLRKATLSEGCRALFRVSHMRNIPELRELMPQKKNVDEECVVCCGSGRLSVDSVPIASIEEACFACFGRGWLSATELNHWQTTIEQHKALPDRRSKPNAAQQKELGQFLTHVFLNIRSMGYAYTSPVQFRDLAEALHNVPNHMFDEELYWDWVLASLQAYDTKYNASLASWFERIIEMSD